MPNFNEDVIIRGHDLVLKHAGGDVLARLDENGSLTMHREIAGKAVQVLQFAAGQIFGAPLTVLIVGAEQAPGTIQVRGSIVVKDGKNEERIKLDGDKGDIILSNADAAEDFEVATGTDVAAGMVMVLGEDGKLTPCTSAYDQSAVGVISGAGRYRPGLVFDRGAEPDDHRVPISVMGKVSCRADASFGSIRVGDLLTTSHSPGYAMKATDPTRAFGTIIGKALGPLTDGRGLVPILISLQ